MTEEQRQAIRMALVQHMMLARNALTPSFGRTASDGAGYCLWALGIERFEEFEAKRPVKEIDGKATRLLTAEANTPK